MINNKSDKNIQIKQNTRDHKAHYKYKNIIKNKKISTKTKLKIYKTAVRPVVIYPGETICLTNKNEERLKVFKRKIIGPKKIDNAYRRLINMEIIYKEKIYKEKVMN